MSPIILDAHLHKGFLLDTLRQLAQLGHNTFLIATRSRYAYRNEDPRVRVMSVPLRYVPVVSPILFAGILSIFLPIYIIKSKADFIIIEPDVSVLSSIPSLLISKFRKQKFVLDVRSVPVETVGFRGFLTRFWFSASVLIAKKMFNGLTIITPLMSKEVCNSYNIDSKKVGVWTCGVSPIMFDPKNYISQNDELRTHFGFSGKFIVFYHGIFTATRGLIETIKAIRILKREHPDIVFFLLGSGPIVPVMKELIQMEGLQDNVIIHDPVPHNKVQEFIQMSDVCIVPFPYNPYWRFQCPVKLLEYLAMEKVVILTDIPAHRSIINKEKSAIYVSSIEPVDIAKTIEYAYQNKERLEEWGKSGRTAILENYTMEKISRDLENYLQSLE